MLNIEPLALKPDAQIAQGLQRSVYLHPTDTGKLIKVLLPTPETAGRSAFGNTVERLFPAARSRQIRKEYLEYARVMLANPDPGFQPPISHMFGFVTTNLGLGCITEKVTDTDGNTLAPTLHSLIEQDALTDRHLALLNTTVSRIYALDIRAGDLKARNFVFGHRAVVTNRGPLECVLVDGFGDIHAIPVRSLSRWTNRLGLDDSFKRLARKKPLVWGPTTRQFSRS